MTITQELLSNLIAFPTVSRDSNLALIAFVRDFLATRGIEVTLIESEDGKKANLFATLGPKDQAGVLLSGHSDVVPVEGQAWSSDPFTLTKRGGKLYGRGTADMKGFIAATLALADRLDQKRLKRPIHLAFSYDEEVGCLGVRRMIEMLKGLSVKPSLCIVGEPTGHQVVTAHKGKTAARVTAIGTEMHSSLAPNGLNAIHLAADAVRAIRQMQDEVAASGARDEDYEIPFSTLHVGVIAGGTALNIVPNRCHFDFEIRHLAADDPNQLLDELRGRFQAILAPWRARFPLAALDIAIANSYPGLDTPPDSEAVLFVKRLTGGNSTGKITFGTEGGLFSRDLGVPTVVCGPGFIEQAHKPDEFLAESELAACDRLLDRLADALS